MRSLTVKFTLAFLLVGLVAVLLVGGAVTLLTRYAFDRFEYDRDVVSLTNMLESYYRSNGSWAGVDSILQRPRFQKTRDDWSRQPVALLDAKRDFVFGVGDFASRDKLTAAEIRRGLELQVDGQTVGWLVIGTAAPPAPDRAAVPEDLLLRRIVSATVWAALGALGLALILGALLARSLAHPIHDLTQATRDIARGELGRQVTIRSRDELGQLATSFNSMSADLERTREARRQMTADIAHELRTPLSVIVGYTEALQDGKLQGNPAIYAAMNETAQHLQHLVEDLRTLALADAGELSLNRRPADPLALLERAQATHAAQAQAAGVDLRIEAPEELPPAQMDPERIAQVLNNLVANALRYTPAGGQIVLSAEAEPAGAAVILRVRDTGSGITPADLPFVFERFYRGDKARQQEHGESGLGLAIARSIVESHAGSIEVESQVGVGTTFTIRLPAA